MFKSINEAKNYMNSKYGKSATKDVTNSYPKITGMIYTDTDSMKDGLTDEEMFGTIEELEKEYQEDQHKQIEENIKELNNMLDKFQVELKKNKMMVKNCVYIGWSGEKAKDIAALIINLYYEGYSDVILTFKPKGCHFAVKYIYKWKDLDTFDKLVREIQETIDYLFN